MKGLRQIIHLVVPCLGALVCPLAPLDAHVFDNLEADIYYGGPLKEQIAKEYAVLLEGLKRQADGYGVPVREKDILRRTSAFYLQSGDGDALS